MCQSFISFQSVSRDDLYDLLVPFVHSLYFKHLLVNPKDRRVVLVDPLLGAIRVKVGSLYFSHDQIDY